MYMKARFSILGVAWLLVGSGSPEPDVQLAPAGKVEGTWKIEKFYYDGRQMDPEPYDVVIKAGGASIRDNGRVVLALRFTYQLDASVTPATIDLKRNHDLWRGIWKLAGDELTVSLGSVNQPRPVDFLPRADMVLAVLKRVK